MANPDPDLLSIGAFSRMTRLSQKALRLYGSLEIDGSPRETWRHSFPLQGAPDMEISWKFIEVT